MVTQECFSLSFQHPPFSPSLSILPSTLESHRQAIPRSLSLVSCSKVGICHRHSFHVEQFSLCRSVERIPLQELCPKRQSPRQEKGKHRFSFIRYRHQLKGRERKLG